MGGLSIWHWIIVIGVVLLLFGRGKISELMGDVAQGIKAFKKGMSDDEAAKAETPAPTPRPIPRSSTISRPRPSAPRPRAARPVKARLPRGCAAGRRAWPQSGALGVGMFDIGWSELVVIAVVALIAIGPKELPGVLRSVGHWMGKIRQMAGGISGPVPGGDARGGNVRPQEARRRSQRRWPKALTSGLTSTLRSLRHAEGIADGDYDRHRPARRRRRATRRLAARTTAAAPAPRRCRRRRIIAQVAAMPDVTPAAEAAVAPDAVTRRAAPRAVRRDA